MTATAASTASMIPWLEGIEEAEEARETLAMAQRFAADVRYINAALGEINTELAAAGNAPVPHDDGSAEAARMVDEDAATLAEIEARVVYFTAYHRRCWESAGRPGFQGQSPRARDQGA